MIPVVVIGALVLGGAYLFTRGQGAPHMVSPLPPAYRGVAIVPSGPPYTPGVAKPQTTEESLAYNVVMPYPVYDGGLVPSSAQRSTRWTA